MNLCRRTCLPHPHAELKIDHCAALARWFAERCTETALRATAERGRFSLAIAGGSAADAFLPELARSAIDWGQVDLFWCDERDVPVGDPASNYGQALRLLADSNILTRARVHPMVTSRVARLADAATSYARALEDILGNPPVIDVVLLGVGEDGHVASIFPASRALAERHAWVVAVIDAPKPPARRLTLTRPVFENARVICIGAFGAEKATALRAALDDPQADTPAALLLREAREAWILLDPAAASLLAS